MSKKDKKQDFFSSLTATYTPAFGSSRLIRRSRASDDSQPKAIHTVKVRVRQDDISAIEATQQAVKAYGVEYVDSLGWMITSVNGIKQDPSKGLFWKYFVNDEFISTGAEKYTVSRGDRVEWRLVEAISVE